MSKYPQPEVVTPPEKTRYYIVDNVGRINDCTWNNESWDIARLANHKVYLAAEAARSRFEWDLQEAKKRTVPAWFRALGPIENIECNHTAGSWKPLYISFDPDDWTQVSEANYRAKSVEPPVALPTRKIVQITECGEGSSALCNDGTVWALTSAGWKRIPSIPQG